MIYLTSASNIYIIHTNINIILNQNFNLFYILLLKNLLQKIQFLYFNLSFM
jgi:hypothetical protein